MDAYEIMSELFRLTDYTISEPAFNISRFRRNNRLEGALLTGGMEGSNRLLLPEAAGRQRPLVRPLLGRELPLLSNEPDGSFLPLAARNPPFSNRPNSGPT